MPGSLLLRAGIFAPPVPPPVRSLMRAIAGHNGDDQELLELDEDTISLVVSEGLGPLLGAWISAGRIVVPEKRRDGLIWEHQVCVAANLIRSNAVHTLVRSYQQRSLPLVLLKGMALVQHAFGPGERSMADLDVLVPSSRWAEACDLAIQLGCRKDPSPGRQYTATHDYVRAFTSSDGVAIEIHRYVCERSLFSVDYEGVNGIFSRTRKLKSGALLPAEDDLFLTLVAHAAKHTLELPLRSFADGIVLLRTLKMPFEALRTRARQWGMESALHAWMTILYGLQGLSVPSAVRKRKAGEQTFPDSAPVSSFRPEDRMGGSDRTSGTLATEFGRMVWARTSHSPPWQRFIRLAWLTDSLLQWGGHVGTRVGFRAIDAALSLRPEVMGPQDAEAGAPRVPFRDG